jgi:hypothetical protein
MSGLERHRDDYSWRVTRNIGAKHRPGHFGSRIARARGGNRGAASAPAVSVMSDADKLAMRGGAERARHPRACARDGLEHPEFRQAHARQDCCAIRAPARARASGQTAARFARLKKRRREAGQRLQMTNDPGMQCGVYRQDAFRKTRFTSDNHHSRKQSAAVRSADRRNIHPLYAT